MTDDLVEQLRQELHEWEIELAIEQRKQAAEEIDRLRGENNKLLVELNKFTETSLQSTKMIKDLVSDLKNETELRIRLEKICERQHGILVENGIFPAKEIKQ